MDAICRNNHLTVTLTTNLTSAKIELDERLIDFGKPVTLEVNGRVTTQKVKPSLRVLGETLQRRGEPDLAFTAEIAVSPAAATKPAAK